MPGIRRLTARNPGPFTFHGTNTYLLGQKELIVVDPGPDDPDHVQTISDAANGQIGAILVTHTHMDHSPGARRLQKLTGAPIIGCEAHKPARPLGSDEVNPLDASADKEHQPDEILADGQKFATADLSVVTIATPGHTANHLCFQIDGSDVLLSADHVMAWSTSIVAPPDGNMQDYMASLDKLIDTPAGHYFPGHGGAITNARDYVADLKQHRLLREQAILDQLSSGAKSIPSIVEVLYSNIDRSLFPAAGLSVFAHLEDLTARGKVLPAPHLSLSAIFKLA